MYIGKAAAAGVHLCATFVAVVIVWFLIEIAYLSGKMNRNLCTF